MRFLFLLPIALLILSASASAQIEALPPTTTKARTFNPRDVAALSFCAELRTQKLGANSGVKFDDLSVIASNQFDALSIRISGRKRQNVATQKGGREICHSGKVALLPPADREGTLTVNVPSIQDATYYSIVLELPDDTLKTTFIKVAPGNTYSWSLKSENGQSTLRVLNGSTEIAALSAANSQVRGFGFAATVRWKANEADITIHCR